MPVDPSVLAYLLVTYRHSHSTALHLPPEVHQLVLQWHDPFFGRWLYFETHINVKHMRHVENVGFALKSSSIVLWFIPSTTDHFRVSCPASFPRYFALHGIDCVKYQVTSCAALKGEGYPTWPSRNGKWELRRCIRSAMVIPIEADYGHTTTGVELLPDGTAVVFQEREPPGTADATGRGRRLSGRRRLMTVDAEERHLTASGVGPMQTRQCISRFWQDGHDKEAGS
eukprot:TRINITY_DN18297_c0_g2_i2.p1 TRINITY_DN18297_c0_g2~~TRINITY_DN18297_c0_g2_i2.p1  ORF type:complete len:234 (+),score=25.46 TRINITY_DN18297_c0_g2_i2:22-702(+)